jgi:hypothetical protein
VGGNVFQQPAATDAGASAHNGGAIHVAGCN